MRALTRVLFAALVIAAVVAAWWFDTVREPPTERPAPEAEGERPDSYFEGFRLRAHAGTGAPRYTLDGRRLLRYGAGGAATVEAPRLHYRPDDTPPWHVTGAHGRLRPGGDRVDLAGDVVLRRVPAGAPPLVVETSRLSVFTAAGRAETDRPITARSPGWRVAATGMTALFGAGRVDLHADVRGRYDPLAGDDG